MEAISGLQGLVYLETMILFPVPKPPQSFHSFRFRVLTLNSKPFTCSLACEFYPGGEVVCVLECRTQSLAGVGLLRR